MFVSPKLPVGPSQAIAAVFEEHQPSPTRRRADPASTAFAYDSFGAPGNVVADQRIDDPGCARSASPTMSASTSRRPITKEGRVRFEVRMAGGQLALPRDKPGLGLLMSADLRARRHGQAVARRH